MAEELETVIAVSFKEDSKAYEALSALKELRSREKIMLHAAAIAVREQDGKLEVKDEVGDEEFPPIAAGGLLGLVIGIVGGPLGVLIGGVVGLVGGAVYEDSDEGKTESVLADISRSAAVGHTVLLAQLYEPVPAEVDEAMAELGGTVVRQSATAVEAEVGAAEAAQRAARKKAQKELREERDAHRKDEAHDKVEALRAKLHRHKDTEKQAAGTASGT